MTTRDDAQRRSRWLMTLAGLTMLACLGLMALAPRAHAAPDITLDKQAPSSVLFGDDSSVRLRVVNPVGQPYGYNLSFRDVLPAGISYVSAPESLEPKIIANAPAPGQTTLIFENVSDLSPGSSYELNYKVRHDTGLFSIGDSYVNEAAAYINTDPHFVPDFGPGGEATGDFTGEATDTASTEISAIEIVKGEESPEGELLRGVHDHQTVYTLTVRNNAIEETTDLVVEDWLPAGLEFLGCGEADNTTDAPTNPGSPLEYPGAEPINPGNAPAAPDCEVPSSVETVETDPDGAGPMPNAVYTHVVWSGLGNVPATDEIELQYVAAVPIRENTMDWGLGGAPLPASLEQASNLDNNSGAETFDEQALTNFARVEGDYEGTDPVSDDHTLTRVAEDLAVQKGVAPKTINQGQISKWTLHIETSEYRYVENIRVEDFLPDGLCPLGNANYEDVADVSGECAPTGEPADLPNHEYTTATENPEGGFTVVWDETTVPQLGQIGPSQSFTIEFPTRTRAFYQDEFVDDEKKPVLAEDSWENKVEIEGPDYRICAPSDPLCTGSGTEIDGDEADGEPDFDSSAASQHAGGIKIDKKVATPTTPMDCTTASYVDGPAPSYGPGDTICWQLRIDFASKLETGEPRLTDFLPPGVSYVEGSAAATGENDVSSTPDFSDAANGVLSWDLGTDVNSGGLVFEWTFATKVGQSVSDEVGDLKGNLMKLSFENTAGTTFPLRDEVEFAHSQAQLSLIKGVNRVNAVPTGNEGKEEPNVDGVAVKAGDFVEYRIDVTNEGDLPATNVAVRDILEDGITCADVSIVSHMGGCSGGRIEWFHELSIAPGATETFLYSIFVPSGVVPGTRFDDRAGILSYQSETNASGFPPEFFTYVPAENIGEGGPPANAPAADDDSWVHTRAVAVSKQRTTAVGEDGNELASQATIGERIDYVVKIVVPEGTTIYGSPKLTDNLGERLTFVEPPAAVATLDGGALPAEVTLDTTGNAVSLQFPETYENEAGSGDDTFEVKFSAKVTDVLANSRVAPKETLRNTATFAWEHQDATKESQPAHVDTTIVEPDVALAKTDDDADKVVTAGQTVNYTITASNPTGTRISTAHDLAIVDHVPDGLAPVLPIANAGVWNAGERTITWDIPSIIPGAQVQRTYAAEVVEPATAGEVFKNEADLSATSMAGTVEGERGPGSPNDEGYVAEAEDEVRLGDATLEKTASPTEATIGQQVTYTTEVTFPANVDYFDTTVIDHLPDGLVYDATTSVTCNGGSCEPSVVPLAAESQPNGESTVAWFLGDFQSEPAGRTYEITYTAHVGAEYVPPAPVSDGQTLTNVAQAAYNGSDQLSEPPATIPSPEEFTSQSNTDQAVVDVIEPDIVLDKAVSGDADEDDVRSTEPGDSYTYSVTVRNTGTAPAYDVEVTDSWDPTQLTNVSVLTTSGATDEDGSDGDLEWILPGPIAPNAAVVLEYTADLAFSASLSDGETIVNTAAVPLLWGLDEATRDEQPTWDYREYTEVPDDTVTLNVHLPQLQVVKTPDAAEVPDSIAEVGQPFSWRVAVKNTSTVATAHSVDLHDVLPANWDYLSGSASFSPGGTVDPSEVVSAPTGDTLTWEDVGDLGPGEEIVLSFEATPTVAAITDPGTGGSAPNVNDARAEAVDSSGAGSSAEGAYQAEDEGQAVLTLPELTIEKTPDGDVVEAGEDAGYSILIENEGDVPAREVVVTDVLGQGQTYTAGMATASPNTGFSESSVDVTAGETTIEWLITEIPAGGSVTITLPVATDPGLADGSDLLNAAAVSSREITTPIGDGGSHEVDVDSDVGIVKQAQADPVDAGEEMDFTLTVSNHGPSDATGVTVDDELPANLEFVSAETPCAHLAGTVTCAIGELDAGESVELTLRVKVDPDETVEVSNTASVDSMTPDSNSSNDESTATKPVGVEANIQVEKEGPGAPVLQGTSFDYVIRVDNAGVSAATDVTLSDPLPAAVEFENVTSDVGSCSEASGTIECSFGTLEPNDGAVVTVTVRAVDVGTPTNVATVGTPSTETTTTDNEAEAAVEILPAADLAVTKTAPPTAPAGTELTYLLEVVNNGPSPATGVTLTDNLPGGVHVVSTDPACNHAAGVVICAVGDLAVSESHSYEVTVAIPFALGGSTLTNSVVVGGNEGDLVTENDGDQATTTVGPAADLTISKTAGGATAGGTASWTIAVHNKGPSAGPAMVKDALPAGTSFRSATPSQGHCGASGAEVICDLGVLSAGGSAQITVVADVAADAARKQLRNRAMVNGEHPDPDLTNNTAEAVNEVAEPQRAASAFDLVLTKTASTQRPELGKPFSYRLLVRNVGGSDAKKVRVVDTLSEDVELKDVSASKGSCSGEGSKVTCGLGTIPAGKQASVKLVVVPIAPGGLRNTASVSAAGEADAETADNVDVAGVQVMAPKARWTLTKRTSRRVVRGGDAVRFAITVRMRGRAVAGARVCDPLPSGLVFIKAPGAQFHAGKACWKLGYLAPNARRTVRIVARAERSYGVRRVRNVAEAMAGNASRRVAGARVRINPAFGGDGGGVTG